MVDTFQTCLDLQPVPPMWGPAAQEGKKLFYVSLFMYFKLTYPNFSSSGPGGSGGAVRQRKGAAGGSFLFSFEFYLSH